MMETRSGELSNTCPVRYSARFRSVMSVMVTSTRSNRADGCGNVIVNSAVSVSPFRLWRTVSASKDVRPSAMAISSRRKTSWVSGTKTLCSETRSSSLRYRYIFDSTGVSIWEEDFSQVKVAIDELRSRGVRDFREYFAAHPEFVQQAITMVRIVDVNDVSVKLFAAESKDELLVSLHKVFVPETQEVFLRELIAIAEGRTSFEAETVLQSLKGDTLTALFTITFPQPSARFDRVLVTITDITERKRAEYLTGQVFESSPDRVSIIGRDYRYQRVNPVFERFWRVPAEKAVGMHVADLLGME